MAALSNEVIVLVFCTGYMVATVDQIYLHMYRKNGIVKHEKLQTK